MMVKELMKILKKCNPNSEVIFDTHSWGFFRDFDKLMNKYDCEITYGCAEVVGVIDPCDDYVLLSADIEDVKTRNNLYGYIGYWKDYKKGEAE